MKPSLRHFLLGAAVSALFLLNACSSTPAALGLSPEQAAAKHGYDIVKPVKRVHDYRLNGWAYIDQQNVVMYSSPSRSYLLTLKQRCNDLRAVENIAIESRTGVLVAGLDAIKILPRHSRVIQPCYIDGIYLLKKMQGDSPAERKSVDNGASDLAAR